MSLYSVLNSSIAGMAAQSNRIGTIADNISNSSTTGYKRVSTEFETIMGQGSTSAYSGGSVASKYRNSISEQGTLQATSNPTDLAVNGKGFFLVSRPGTSPLLTRAGAFQPTAEGFLENSAGYRLMGLDLSSGTDSLSAAGVQSMTPVQIDSQGLVASASTSGSLVANLPAQSAAISPAQLASTNSPNAAFTAKTSIVTYDNLGAKVPIDIYFSKSGSNSWDVAAYNAKDASAGGLPYSSGPIATASMTFDPGTGRPLSSGARSLILNVPNGASVGLDLGQMTQFASDYSVSSMVMDGHAPAAFDHVEIAADGTLSSVFQDGTKLASFKIPLAGVTNPDGLRPVDGNAFEEATNSGAITLGDAGSGVFGKIIGSTLESSTVDLAGELTSMIQSQRSYTMNTKVFQAGSDMLEIISNLKV